MILMVVLIVKIAVLNVILADTILSTIEFFVSIAVKDTTIVKKCKDASRSMKLSHA